VTEWEEIVPGVRYVNLATGGILVPERVTRTAVFLEDGRRVSIWDFRLRVMPSGKTTRTADE